MPKTQIRLTPKNLNSQTYLKNRHLLNTHFQPNSSFFTLYSSFLGLFFAIWQKNPDKIGLSFCEEKAFGSDIVANEVRSRVADGCICLPFEHGERHIENAKLRERRVYETRSKVGSENRQDRELTRPHKS